MIAVVIGGSGSGKSAFAEKLAAADTAAHHIYLATMQRGEDEESRRRIARHQAMRAERGFQTVERTMNLDALELPSGACVLLEDLPNLVANEMFSGGCPETLPEALERLCSRCASLIVVTGNVFADGAVYDEGTQAWLRCLTECAARLSARADLVIEVVCGIPIRQK